MPIILLLAGFLIYSTYKGGTALYNELRFSVKKIDFQNISLAGAKFKMQLAINNPTPYSVNISSITGAVQTNTGTILGNYDILQPFTIAPKQTTVIDVSVTASSLAVIQQIIQAVKTGTTPPLNLSGNIETSLGRFPFTNNVTQGLNLKTKAA